jgi:2'-5' RNA ligase
MTKMKYNLGLIFEPIWEERLVSFSQELRVGCQSSVQLGPKVLPHVTIVQFEASAPEAQEYWKRVQALPPPSLQVSFTGLTFLPSSKDGMWVEISVYRNKALESLQNQALCVLSPREPLNKVGELYRPHVTLARFDGFVWPTLKALPYELLRATNLTTYLAIGRSGEFEIGSLRP